MKKGILALTAMLLMLMFTVAPAAFADQYCNLNSVTAGTELRNLAVATVPADSTVNWDFLPQGCTLNSETKADGLHLYISGTPVAAGTCQFTLSVSSSLGTYSIICSMNVVPALPVVFTGADMECCVGDSAPISVIASAADGGMLSYQWYSNTFSGTGNGSPISGANSATYNAPTASAGTRYYYCVVTNTNNGRTNSELSAPITVKVTARSVESISVYSMPEKTEYTAGDTLQKAGLRVQVRYSDGSTGLIEQGFDISPAVLDKVGSQSVEVSYQGKTCRFSVNVVSKADAIRGMGVLTLPGKTKYEKGDALDTAGLSVRVYTNDGYYDVSTGLQCSPMKLDTAGNQTVTVSYKGKTCTFNVTVEEVKKPVSAAVASMPAKLDYIVGEKLDTAGLVLTITNIDQKTEKVKTGFVCEPMLLNTAGRQRIIVSYGEMRCDFYVTVSEKTEGTPQVSPSPEVIGGTDDNKGDNTAQPSPSPTPSSHVIQHSSHKSSAGSGFLKFIVVVCVLALVGLGAYVYIMNHGGLEKVLSGKLFRRDRDDDRR